VNLGQHPWLEAYAAPSAVPGGGSAAAVAGALGCALLSMTARVGARKAGPGAAELEALALEADRLRASFLAAEAADAAAYERMVATGRAARAAAGDREAARAAEAAQVDAARVPLGTAELAARGLELTAALAGHGLARTASDQFVAVHLLRAALEGGLATVAVNLPGLAEPAREALAARHAELAKARGTAAEAAARLEPMLR
jgi:glutamate formiminotransferase/formiminotetrahydrofolate cyclodeaminase